MSAPPITADRVTSALAGTLKSMVKGLGGDAFVRLAGDAALIVTRVPFPTMNGVLMMRPRVAPDVIEELLRDPALASTVHAVQVRPGCSPDVTSMLERRGMHEDEPIPLMAMPSPTEALKRAADVPKLEIGVIDPSDAQLHGLIAAEGFQVPAEMFDSFAKPSVLAQPGMRTYVGKVDGRPVTTAICVRIDDYAGIFDVATPPAYRGRGYGAAVTARATLDGFDSGATFAFLQSSPMGLAVYERLGFRTLETWSVWISDLPSHS